MLTNKYRFLFIHSLQLMPPKPRHKRFVGFQLLLFKKEVILFVYYLLGCGCGCGGGGGGVHK